MIIFTKLITDTLVFLFSYLIFLGLHVLQNLGQRSEIAYSPHFWLFLICFICYAAALLLSNGYKDPNERNFYIDLQFYLRFAVQYSVLVCICTLLLPVDDSYREFIIFLAISSLMIWVFRHLLHAFIFTYFLHPIGFYWIIMYIP